MMQTLRPYQARAVSLVRREWAAGHSSVCLVAPTGSGKTTMGAALVASEPRAVWVAHQRELVAQAVERLRSHGLRVGAHCPGMLADRDAPVQVGTIQTLLASGARPPADLVVLDEAHHHAPASEHWSTFQDAYPDARKLGLTATPERRDGSPLGDVFTALVVAASYSELLAEGHLAQCVVYAPPRDKARSGWSMDPVQAYTTLAPGTLAFAFFSRVPIAEEWERAFNVAGVPARTIHGKTPASERADILCQFAAGRVRVVCNVATMTEGVDVPAAGTIILAHYPSHASGFLQRVGRALRPHPGKPHALVLDLVDATSKHGYPTDDREYSLTGEAIARSAASGVRRCMSCMAMYPAGLARCPMCGAEPVVAPPPVVHIYSAGLARVYQGADTADEHKLAEYKRLRSLARSRGFSLSFVVAEYKKLFGVEPSLRGVPEAEKRAEYDRLRAVQVAKALKPGFVGVRYKALFGEWPPREWGYAPLRASGADT